MPSVGFVANQNPARDYTYFNKQHLAVTFVTSGFDLDIEKIANGIRLSKPDDFLILDGPGAISALCLNVWIEMHNLCRFYVFNPIKNEWQLHSVSKDSVRRMIEYTKDQRGSA